MNNYNAFTDGGAFPNPGYSHAYSFIVINQNNKIITCQSHIIQYKRKKTTSIIAELFGLLKCMQKINKNKYYPIIIYTDSQYVEKIYNLKAHAKVHKNIWNSINKQKNQQIVVKWIKGHSQSKGNIIADKLIGITNNIFKTYKQKKI